MNTDIFCPNCQGYVTKVNPAWISKFLKNYNIL